MNDRNDSKQDKEEEYGKSNEANCLKTNSKDGNLKKSPKDCISKTKSKDCSTRQNKKNSGKFYATKNPYCSSKKTSSDLTEGEEVLNTSGKQAQKEDVYLTPEGGLPPELLGETAYDCCAFLMYCLKHDKIAISRSEKGCSWLPFVALKFGDSWNNAAMGGSSFIISHRDIDVFTRMGGELPFFTPEILHVFRIQIPGVLKFISRVVYVVRLNNEIRFNCCKNDKRVEWISRNQIESGNIDNLWGPEPFLWSDKVKTDLSRKRSLDEYSLDDALRFSPRDTPKNKEEELLKSSGFSDKEITRLYVEFVMHCFPSRFMPPQSFVAFMMKIGWNGAEDRLCSIFNAFNYRSNGYLTFHELLLGLVAMEPSVKHGGSTAELRCGYIFRYYDSDNDGLLEYSDIYRMTADIYSGKKTEVDEKTIEKDALHRMEQVLKVKRTDKVQIIQFMIAIGNMSFRGTSVLFRSMVSIMKRLSQRICFTAQDISGDIHPSIVKRQYRGTCQSCKQKNYRICVFSVKLDFTGRIIDPKSLEETEGTDIKWKSSDPVINQLRAYSRETVFNEKSLPNTTILTILKQFDEIHKQRIETLYPEVREWNKIDRNDILTSVQSLCKKTEEIFANEPRCVKLSSPVFVLGDTHGNISDVLVYERNLWNNGPTCAPSNFLFLGDYVDRGEYGIEVVCYLFSMKILAPEKFYLCRGNHEIRSIQKCYTFLKECNVKYGTRVGPQVFEFCNSAFDKMPVCAIIDDCIFGAHGGIPTSMMRIDELMRIPSPLQEPENESPAAWEMMWSDPMNINEFNELSEFMKAKPEKTHGFLSNSKRGTAFFYSEEAVNNFLRVNKLQYILRGHEVMPLGYKFHLNGKVITIFSSSRYCGGLNEAASVFCDNEEIRVVRFETQEVL